MLVYPYFLSILFFFQIALISSGTFFQPTNVDAIAQSIANRNEYSDYTFNIIPSTPIPIDGTLEITFPSQFILGLGIQIDPNSNNYCNMPCGVANYVVTLQITAVSLPGVTSSFTVYSVKNPSTKGSTGNFIIRSKKGINILDENLVFGVIGIADSIKNLTSPTVALDSSGVSSAGMLTKYSFSFKTNQIIPWNSYFMITIPASSGFSISKSPSCSAFTINGNIITGILSCTSQTNNIIVRGLAADIPTAFEVGISVSVTNPTVSGTSGTFQIAIFRNGTNVVYAWSTGITGVTITPGAISKVIFSQINPILVASKNKLMNYRLRFIPKNSLPLGAQIYVQFPMIAISNCYIEYGIEDIDPTVPTKCVPQGSNSLLITGFQAIDNPGEISLTVRLKNPDNYGITTPVKIYTYKDLSKTIIDQDVTSATVNIQNIESTSISPISVIVTSTTNYLADSTTGNFQFSINPSITIPALGYIQITVPSSFTIGSLAASDCKFGTTDSFSCMKTDQVILMQLPASISFNIGSSSIFSIANYKIRKPIYGGDFLFDISTYNTNGKTVLDSYSMNLIITPNVLSTAGLQLIGKEIGKIGILQVDFTTILAVPSGKDQTQASDTKGVIQLKFSGGWASDLGNGLSDNDRISCTSIYGILPISGLTFGCYIIPSQKSIEIRNFQDLKTGTVCRIYIPNIVISSGLVEINLIKRYNRLDLVVNKYAATPATTAGAALSPSYVSASYTFSNNYVSNIFNLEFNLDLAQNTISGDYFLVKLSTYDVGYLQDDSMVTCFLGFVGTTPSSFECIKFTIIDWILIKMTKPYDTSQIVRLYLNNLKWPRYAFKTGKPLYIVHYSNFVETEYKNYQKFEDLNVPVYNIFYSALMNVPKKGKGYPDCAYYFKFKALNSIPDGGTVVLTFPTDYSLRSSFPSPYFSANQFTGFNGNPLVFTPSANKLSISNIAAFTEKSLFTIVVKGIKNPSPLITTSTGWSIETNYNGNIINKQDNFDFFQYGNSYSSGTIIFNSITAFPQNALVLANYNIKFTPNTPIPALGIISITFPPAQFSSNIPANPSCVISGGLETFYSCVLSGTTITIITDSEYTTGSLTVTIKDVTNPAAGITDGFNIITFYDNSFLDQTDDYDDSYRTVLILPQANPLTVNSIDFEPRNEGEKAQYTFVFIPSSNLYRNMEIMIKFPDNYDDLLGSSIQCVGKAGIVGDLTVSVSQKKLFLTGLEVYTPSNDNPLTIIVYNVINPNRISNLGKFRIATYYSNTYTFIDYNEDINGLEMITAAGWLQLFNITADHYNARLKANYTFNFTLSKTLPNAASEGYILIDYPSQFDIPDKNVSCVNTLAIFGNMSCQIKNNRVYASGNTDTYIGNLFMTFYYIDNPTLSGSTGDLTVMSYDGFNKYIIERSFPNLDPFAFIFSYPGPLIIVNGDEDIIVEKGTQTKDLSITLDYPCALNLTFSSLTTSFSLTPTLIYMNRGDLQSTFRVSVPVSLTEGIYYINWQTEGDQISPIYTPLKKTKVTVTYLKNVPIDISEVANIPYGGSSLTITASVVYSPNVGIELVANLDDNYPGVSLTKKNIIFSAGYNTETFQILYSNDSATTERNLISKGGVTIILSGVNKDTYTLTTSHISFVVISANIQSPTLTELLTSDIGQTFCQLTIGANEIVVAYYMVALTGTANPNLTEVQNQGPIDQNTTQKQYGVVYIGSSNRITIRINKLFAQTPYTIYIYLKNRGSNVNKIKTYDFVTLDRNQAAEFSLQFLQAYLNNAEKSTIITSIAFVLSMPPGNIYEKNYTFTSRILADECLERNLASTQTVSTILTLNIFSVTNSSNYPSPLKMAQLLNNKTASLNSLLTNFDTTYTIPSSLFSIYVPSFVESPTVPTISQFSISIKAKLDNFGFIYAIALNASQDKSKPSSFQIYNGYDSGNLPCQAGWIEASEAFVYFTFDILNLTADTQYNIYITAGSVHPGYPDLILDKSIVLVAVQTKPLIIFDPLNINSLKKLDVVSILVIVLELFFFLEITAF